VWDIQWKRYISILLLLSILLSVGSNVMYLWECCIDSSDMLLQKKEENQEEGRTKGERAYEGQYEQESYMITKPHLVTSFSFYAFQHTPCIRKLICFSAILSNGIWSPNFPRTPLKSEPLCPLLNTHLGKQISGTVLEGTTSGG
jgi:hypothetical protein